MPTPFHTSRFVEFSDTDMAGIMHFAAFFRFMEAAEHQLVRNLGFSVYSQVDGDVVSFPRVAATCEFHSPARCEDVLEIDVTVERVGTKSVTYRFAFSQHGRDVATGDDDQRLLPHSAWRAARFDSDSGRDRRQASRDGQRLTTRVPCLRRRGVGMIPAARMLTRLRRESMAPWRRHVARLSGCRGAG